MRCRGSWICSLVPHVLGRALDAPRRTCRLCLHHTNLSSEDARVDSLHYEVGPDGVEDEERREQPIQNVVCWKHFHELRRLDCRAAEVYKLSWTTSDDKTFVTNGYNFSTGGAKTSVCLMQKSKL